jgi:hypothetical protein
MVDFEKLLSEIDSVILSQARQIAPNSFDVEDYAQIGRIAIFGCCDKGFETPQLLGVSKNAMRNYRTAQFAKKRHPESGFVSLDAPLSIDGDFNLGDVLSADSDEVYTVMGVTESPPQLEKHTMREHLVEKLGRRYIQVISQNTEPMQSVREIVKVCIEEITQLSLAEVPQKVNYDFFVEQGLGWFLWTFYNNSPTDAILDAYGDKLNPWELTRVQKGYWNGKRGLKRAKKAVQWLFDKKEIDTPQKAANVKATDFSENGLAGMLHAVFANSPYLAVKSIYPQITPADKKYCKHKFASVNDIRIALLDYLSTQGVENLEQMTLSEAFESPLRSIGITQLRKNFSGVIMRTPEYNGSAYRLLEAYFPNQIKPWIICGSHSGWNEDKLIKSGEALRWLTLEYWHLPITDIPRHVTQDNLRQVGFGGLLAKQPFANNTYALVDNAFPGVFTPEQFSRNRGLRKTQSV